MGNNMKVLQELQEIDLRLDAWAMEKAALVRDIAGLDEKIAGAQGSISSKQAELDEAEREKTDLEANMEAEFENISRSEVRLKEIKTQKEYQAVSKEVTSAKKIKAELEEQLIEKIARMEEIKAEVDKMGENLNFLTDNAGSQKSEIEDKIKSIDQLVGEYRSERETIIARVQPSLLNRYTMLRQKRQGIAVVEARNGSCLGCNMNLPPQVYNNLFHADNLISCPHCQRLLFLRPQENQ